MTIALGIYLGLGALWLYLARDLGREVWVNQYGIRGLTLLGAIIIFIVIWLPVIIYFTIFGIPND